MVKKAVIAGGTGFIGRYLAEKYRELGYDVLIISRRNGDVQWENLAELRRALEGADLLINLAGKSVDCRYNEKNRREILYSRTETTRILGESIQKCEHPPSLWINSSTATIYRHAEDRAMTEDKGEIGKGFSVDVATSWEKTFFSFQLAHTRQVALRMAIVLGKNGGVIRPFMNLVRFGLGGKQGSGRQMFSWIHIGDLFNVLIFLGEHKALNGVYNCSAPNPVTNDMLMKTFRKIAHSKIALPAPVWLLKIGCAIIRTEPELILKSRWVVPARLLDAGYVFKYPTLDPSLQNILLS